MLAKHPDLRVVVAKSDRFKWAMRVGMPLVDAHDYAEKEGERVRREIEARRG